MENRYSAVAAAREVGRDRRTVSRWWRRHNEDGHANNRHGGGNRRSTNEEEDQRIVEYARHHPFVTANMVKQALNLDCGVDTIRR
jgi:transposase